MAAPPAVGRLGVAGASAGVTVPAGSATGQVPDPDRVRGTVPIVSGEIGGLVDGGSVDGGSVDGGSVDGGSAEGGAGGADPTRLRIDSRRRTFPDLRELMRYRGLVFLLGRRDITVRYRQTILGTTWIFASALVTAGLFSFVFGRIAQLPTNGVPYFVFSYVGLLAWNLFSQGLSNSSTSMTPNSALISKIYFPRLVLPLSTLASTVTTTLISIGILAVMMVGYGIVPTWRLLLLPVWLVIAMVIGLGFGLILASLAVAYRDIGYATPVLISMLLYLSPVAYSLEAVPANLRNLYLLNPIATVVEGTRWAVLDTGYLPPTWAIAYTVVFTVVALLVGVVVFTRREPGFADVI